EQLAKQTKPFFAVIQTAGYHRPYTIPVERDGFELKTLTQKQLDDAGYGSNEDYNSLRFSDFALGRFIEIAKKSPYFKNTLFVIHGDHGLPSGRATTLKKGYAEFGLSRWHVPLLLYGPQVMPPVRKIDKIASPPQIGVINEKYYTFGSPGAVKGYFDWHSEDPQKDLTTEHPEEAKKLVDQAEGVHETAKYLLYHNPHRDHRTAGKR
ncbi:MAG: hypothetical protein EOP05_10315, partial [Proteobacteria bacterium]